jgi:glutaminase
MAEPFVSTGRLPRDAEVGRILAAIHASVAGVADGQNSTVYPALQEADPDLFGLSLCAVDGGRHDVGDVAARFVLMSVSKPFVFALLCADLGAAAAGALIGVDPTGRAFNSVEAITSSPDGRTNPMVNAGAIATASHVRAGGHDERWQRIRDRLGAFAGRELALDTVTYDCVMATNVRNRELVAALAERGRLGCDAEEALVLYSLQCCLQVTAADLAVMGATLANGGRNPVTDEQVIAPELCHPVLAVMLTSGMYEDSGSWLYTVGLPAKSGISGGIVTVAPGKGALGLYSPPLDAAGNSVRGLHAAGLLSAELGLDLLASQPLGGR